MGLFGTLSQLRISSILLLILLSTASFAQEDVDKPKSIEGKEDPLKLKHITAEPSVHDTTPSPTHSVDDTQSTASSSAEQGAKEGLPDSVKDEAAKEEDTHNTALDEQADDIAEEEGPTTASVQDVKEHTSLGEDTSTQGTDNTDGTGATPAEGELILGVDKDVVLSEGPTVHTDTGTESSQPTESELILGVSKGDISEQPTEITETQSESEPVPAGADTSLTADTSTGTPDTDLIFGSQAPTGRTLTLTDHEVPTDESETTVAHSGPLFVGNKSAFESSPNEEQESDQSTAAPSHETTTTETAEDTSSDPLKPTPRIIPDFSRQTAEPQLETEIKKIETAIGEKTEEVFPTPHEFNVDGAETSDKTTDMGPETEGTESTPGETAAASVPTVLTLPNLTQHSFPNATTEPAVETAGADTTAQEYLPFATKSDDIFGAGSNDTAPPADGTAATPDKHSLAPGSSAEPEVAGIPEEPTSDGQPEPSPTGEPEPSAAGEPEPSSTGEPEPSADGEPEPSATGEPEPSAAGEPEPSATGEPEPSAAGEPEPTVASTDGPTVVSDASSPEPEPHSTAEPPPVIAIGVSEPHPSPEHGITTPSFDEQPTETPIQLVTVAHPEAEPTAEPSHPDAEPEPTVTAEEVEPTTAEPVPEETVYNTPFSLRFPDIQWDGAFSDKTSAAYNKFVQQVEPDLKGMVKDILEENYVGMVITRLKEGSVVMEGELHTSQELQRDAHLATLLDNRIKLNNGLGGNRVDGPSIAVRGMASENYAKIPASEPSKDDGTPGYVIGTAIALGVLAILLITFGLIACNQKRNNRSLRLREDDYAVGAAANGGNHSNGVKTWQQDAPQGRDQYAGVNLYEMRDLPDARVNGSGGGRSNAAFTNGRNEPVTISINDDGLR